MWSCFRRQFRAHTCRGIQARWRRRGEGTQTRVEEPRKDCAVLHWKQDYTSGPAVQGAAWRMATVSYQ